MNHFIDSYHLLSYDVLDSTNAEAKRLAEAGGQHGAVIWAETQTEGTGRAGRRWESLRGNLHFSLLLHPTIAIEHAAQLSFVTSLAVFRAITTMVDASVQLHIKWPNDVLLNGKKIAGILLETHHTMHDAMPWVIVGVGVNVEHFPENVRTPATSLKEAGLEIITPKIVLSRFLNMFESLYDEWSENGFQTIRQQWLAHAAYLHEMVTIQLGDKEIRGKFTSIDEVGQLMLRDDAGNVSLYAAGEVQHCTGEKA
jgi:BirA family biotin operon repressor/biotin-[acetyl-CoA-carboxylase] ligase